MTINHSLEQPRYLVSSTVLFAKQQLLQVPPATATFATTRLHSRPLLLRHIGKQPYLHAAHLCILSAREVQQRLVFSKVGQAEVQSIPMLPQPCQAQVLAG